MIKRRRATVVAVAMLLGWVASPAYAGVGEAGDPVTGYWSRTRTGLPVPLEPPNRVPTGGTWVSSDPSGPVAVSAVRAQLSEGLDGLELRLKVADLIGTPAVRACPTLDRWPPEQGGRLEAAPAADCSAPVAARLEQNVLIVPLPPGRSLVELLLTAVPGSVFSLTLERATAASVVTTRRPNTAAPLVPPVPPNPEPVSPGNPTAGPTPVRTDDLFGLPELISPLVGLPTIAAGVEPATEPPVAPALAAPPVPRLALAGSVPSAALFPAPVLPGRRALVANDRPQVLLAVGLLALIGMLAIRLAAQPAVAPRALGGSARRTASGPGRPTGPTLAPTPRGVGRFRTERTRPPIRL